jgi:hypothetical protein
MGLGVATRLGVWKDWYWHAHGTVYGYAPLGLLFLLYSFDAEAAAQLGRYRVLYQATYWLLVACGLWWSLRPPAWVKPNWVRWVEACPENTRRAMLKAVDRKEEWKPHVSSEEQVHAWALALRGKQHKPTPDDHETRNDD